MIQNAVFFDVDGTLVDSVADLATAVNLTRQDLGLGPVTLEKVRESIGCGVRHLLEQAIPEKAGEVDSILPLQAKNYMAHLADQTRLFPGVRETLIELQHRRWLLAVVSNKPAAATREIMTRLGVARFFSAIVGGGDVPALKPDPAGLRLAASRMGHRVSAHDWMVGDNWTDMRLAANAGVHGAFCRFGFGQLRDTRYDVSLARFNELLRCCDEQED